MWIRCPNCGRRDVHEFAYGGESRGDPSDDPTAEFVRVFLRDNTAGSRLEEWYHAAGCGTWFTIQRDTTTSGTHADTQI